MCADDVDEDEEMGDVEDNDRGEVMAQMLEVSPVVELSLNSVVEITTPRSMKLKGKIGDEEVVI